MHVAIYPSNDISGHVCLLRHNYWRSHRIRSVRFAFRWLEKSVVFTLRSEPATSIPPALYKSRDTRLCVGRIFSATYHACALMYHPYPRLTTTLSPASIRRVCVRALPNVRCFPFRRAKNGAAHRNVTQLSNAAICERRKEYISIIGLRLPRSQRYFT